MKRLFYYQFRGLYRVSRWFRIHFTSMGFWILGAMLLALMIGVNTRISLGSQIFTFLLVAITLDGLLSAYFRPKITIKRVLPAFTTFGETIRYHFRISNIGEKAQIGIAIQDNLSQDLPDFKTFKYTRDPNDAKRNWFDRKVGYPKWLWLIRQKRGADIVKGTVVNLQVNETMTVNAQLTSLHRGLIQFHGYLITRPGPFGLFNATHRITDHAQLLVLPKRYAVTPLQLTGSVAYQPGGVVTASTTGNADEFFGLRDYQPGDSKRDIHWKSWAKIGKPIVKEYRPEFLMRHALILDTAVPFALSNRFEVAVSICASYLCTVDSKESLLDLIFIGHQAFRLTLGQGLLTSSQLLKVLATINRAPEQTIDALTSAVMSHAGQMSSCLLVLSCWDESRITLLHQLQAKNIRTRVLVVSETPIDAPTVKTISPETPEIGLKKIG